MLGVSCEVGQLDQCVHFKFPVSLFYQGTLFILIFEFRTFRAVTMIKTITIVIVQGTDMHRVKNSPTMEPLKH